MALTAAQAQQVTSLARQYDGATRTQSFVAWLQAGGYKQLASDLVATLQASGDTTTLQQITAVPKAPAAAAPPALTPQASWATYAQPSSAPAKGMAWGLSSAGKWRQVPIAPGGKFSKAHYIPPQRPGGPREPATADVRFTDPKRIAACATCLAGDWKALFFRVAPRGAPDAHGVSPGAGTVDAGTDYYFEGGDIYPDLSAATPDQWSQIAAQATALWAWWANAPWGPQGGATYYTRNDSLGWYRVYVDGQGYRAYRKWTISELQAFHWNFTLAAPNYKCPRQEMYRDAANDLKCGIDMRGTHGTVLAMCAVFPLARCSVSQTDKRNQMIKKAAVVAGIVATALILPTVAPKLVASLKTLGSKVGGALESQFTGRVSQAVQGSKSIDTAVAQTHAAISTPPQPGAPATTPPPAPPAGASPADVQAYATSLANWYAQQHAAATSQPPPNAAEQAQLAAETQRFLQAGAQVAGGAPANATAATLATTNALSAGNAGLLLGGGALVAVLLALNSKPRAA